MESLSWRLSRTLSMPKNLPTMVRSDRGPAVIRPSCVVQCQISRHGDTGAAVYKIWNSFVIFRNVSTTRNKTTLSNQAEQLHDQFNTALFDTVAAELDPSLQDFEDTFAPVLPPPDQAWLNVLLDFISMGVDMVYAPVLTPVCARFHFLRGTNSSRPGRDAVYHRRFT
jgi:hypothetical protein